MEKKAFDYTLPNYPKRQRDETDERADRYKKGVEHPLGDRIARHVDREADRLIRESVRKR